MTLFLGRNLLHILQVHLAFQSSYSTAVTTNFFPVLLNVSDITLQHVSLLPWGFSVYSHVIKTTVWFQDFLHSLKENQMVVRKLIDTLQIYQISSNWVVNSLNLLLSFLISHNHDSCELSVSFCLYFQLGFGKTLPHWRRSSALALFILFLCPLLFFLLSDSCGQCSLWFFGPLSLFRL